MEPVPTATTAVDVSATGASDGVISFLGMFSGASLVVQGIMMVLLAASFWSWTIIFAKFLHFYRLKSRAAAFEKVFWSGSSLEDLHERIGLSPEDPFSAVFAAAMREWKRALSKDAMSAPFEQKRLLRERIERLMATVAAREMVAVEKNIPFLATVSSCSPFVGLFGMVWGVMTSFESVSLEQNATLATVAPGIAEALFTTALGLLACIPALIAYNRLAREVELYSTRLDRFIDEFIVIFSRQLEENSCS
ncbi:MAG: protein TolQ [Holosporales bacterium]|jgi:biopolymer transport protein TolQ|nr:protein TolQ [Holosporales bacterium]